MMKGFHQEDEAKMSSTFVLTIRLHVLHLSFRNPFFSCLNGIDSVPTSTTTK